MHIQTREQLESLIGETIYHVHSLDSCSIQAWEVEKIYEDKIGLWCTGAPALVEDGVTRLHIARPDADRYGLKADGEFHGRYNEYYMTRSKYNDHFSLSDAGVTNNPYNRHKLFSTLSEAKMYCRTELNLLAKGEAGFKKGEIVAIVSGSGVGKSVLDSIPQVEPMPESQAEVFTIVPRNEYFDAPTILTTHDGGANGMCFDPIIVLEEPEPVTPPHGEIDASIPNLYIVA